MCQTGVQVTFEPCACSYTWAWDPETGQMREVRITCVRHLREASER